MRVPIPDELIAQKVISHVSRSAQPKGDTDRRDLKVLLLAHPVLKSEEGAVLVRLRAAGASEAVVAEWNRPALSEIEAAADEDEFGE